MVSAARKITRYFRRNFGVRFNPLFSENIRCGVIVDIDGPADIDYVTELTDFGATLPELNHGEAHFPDVRSLRELKFDEDKRFDLSEVVPIDGDVKALISSVNALSLSFGPVQMSYLNQVPTESESEGGLAGHFHFAACPLISENYLHFLKISSSK